MTYGVDNLVDVPCGTAGREFAVVDVETTGFGRQDRIVEIAVVCIDVDGVVHDEFSTLVDPQRDVGAVDVHGITPEMVADAPSFRAIAHAIAQRLDGRVFVAHNARFASRFVDKELRRVGLELSLGRPISTLKVTGSRLNLACAAHGIELSDDHRALDAARATGSLLQRCGHDGSPLIPAAVFGYVAPCRTHLAGRPPSVASPHSELHDVVSQVCYPIENPLTLAYLDALDWALNGQAIDTIESARLVQLALDLGVSEDEQSEAHDRYLDAVIAAVEVDGAIGRREHEILSRIARALGRPWPQLSGSAPDTTADVRIVGARTAAA